VTLRGKVLEIGGVKEKTLAAYRAGLREIIMPKGNEKDLREVPAEVRANMAFTFVATMDEVLRLALLPAPSGRAADKEEDQSEMPEVADGPADRRPRDKSPAAVPAD
jgi:ATP-dependent Lon protease